jgi:hypothetical protein
MSVRIQLRHIYARGRDGVVGRAIRYRLGGWGFELWCVKEIIFLSAPVQVSPRAHPGVKRPGRGVDRPPSSGAEIKHR